MARSFDGVSRTISVIPTGPVYGRASILLRRILALLRRSLVVRGALLRVFSGLSEDQRAGLSATASILRAPVCARERAPCLVAENFRFLISFSR